MSEKCITNRHPLLRDGTSQLRRLLKELLPSYVSVDERSMEDLIAFAKRYAEEIFFYDLNNQKNGNWVDFFNQSIDEANASTEPHYALFAAFLELFKIAQEDLNTITGRHLDFYYREVLQLQEKPAVPDQVFIVFELAKNTTTSLLEKGLLLNARKDALNKNVDFEMDKNIVVNKAVVKSLKAVFADKTNEYKIYASPVANSSDGIGGEIEGEPRWRTFGRIGDGNPDRPLAEMGFAIASPILRLGEGRRTITLTLNFTQNLINPSVNLANAFQVLLSGEKAWISAEAVNAGTNSPTANSIVITRILEPSQAAVLDFSSTKLGTQFDSEWPVMKVLMNQQANPFVYSQLKDLILASVNIAVDVSGVKNLTLFNDQSKLKADKPFDPFTGRPVIGSSFYIGSAEVFSKKLDSVNVNLIWNGLPTTRNGFQQYYSGYLNDNASRTNTGFKADLSILDGKVWKPLGAQNLFNNGPVDNTAAENVQTSAQQAAAVSSAQVRTPIQSSTTTLNINVVSLRPAIYVFPNSSRRLRSNSTISISSAALQNVQRDAELESVAALDANTFKGFLRMDLIGADFGHKDYAVSLTRQILMEAPSTIINPPYTPSVKEISISYKSSISINFIANNQNSFNGNTDRYLQVHPFGVKEMNPFILPQPEAMRFLPLFNDEGNLYIGLEELNPAQVVNILFKVAEGSANPDFEKQQVNWSYLVQNQWIEFPMLRIVSDTTNGLLSSGIISFEVPSQANNNNTVLPAGMHWLRATVTNFSGAVCDLSVVTAQAVTATFIDNENDPERLRLPLTAGTISKFRDSNSRVKTISQPYASINGKVKEASADFYMRVSERLRHKNRAITIWDYEHLVLEQFPSVYKVKCISHTEDKPSIYSELSPGHVTLIIISNLRNKNAVNLLQPKTSLTLMEEIKTYILERTSCWVDLDVRNPLFEEIRVKFNVRFRTGFDNGFYGAQLNEDIKKFLSPWAFDPGQDIAFNGKIHKSVILNFIEEREYVDYVTCFVMDHIVGTEVFADVDEAGTQSSASILVSAASHEVHVLETEDCECPDNVQTSQIGPDDAETCNVRPDPGATNGIGADMVNNDFIVGLQPQDTGINFFEIENDFIVE
jgi:Baseplate J-like protein